jgi:hypothetical protein
MIRCIHRIVHSSCYTASSHKSPIEFEECCSSKGKFPLMSIFSHLHNLFNEETCQTDLDFGKSNRKERRVPGRLVKTPDHQAQDTRHWLYAE